MNKIVNTFQFCLLITLLASSSAIAQNPLETVLEDMLDKADGYLLQDQLRTPENANALDRYKAVLILDKNNTRAKAGIEAIGRRYLEFASNAMQRGNFGLAKSRVADAEAVIGETDGTRNLRAAIDRAQIAARKARPAPKPVPIIAEPDVSTDVEFELDPTSLSNREQIMVEQLQSLGLRVKDSREYVLIHARNDAEGRWIYQQMRNASKGYRLRGDIRRSKTPKVILQEPLD